MSAGPKQVKVEVFTLSEKATIDVVWELARWLVGHNIPVRVTPKEIRWERRGSRNPFTGNAQQCGLLIDQPTSVKWVTTDGEIVR